jgi:hypothetical protein
MATTAGAAGPPSPPSSTTGPLTAAVSAGNLIPPTIVPPTDEERRTQSGILKPTMGGIAILNKTDCSAFTGGVPKYDWSELETTTNEYVSPNQLRASYASSKSYNYRKRGLEVKFKKGDNLQTFERKVFAHFKESGLDTISYLPDPEDATRMTSCISGHARYTIDSSRAASSLITSKFDRYDKENDTAAQYYVLDSVDTTLHRKISNKLKDDDHFPALWIILINEFQSTSIGRYDSLKATIRNLSAHQFSGQNVEELSEAFKEAAEELTIAGQYENNYTLKMLTAFIAAGGTGQSAEDYRFELRQLRKPLEDALTLIAYKDKNATLKYMVANKLTYEDICDTASVSYLKYRREDKWQPLHHAKDVKVPARTFGNNLTSIHENSTKTTKPGLCNNCQKPGHWARECPDKKSDGPRSYNRNNRGGRGFDRRSNSRTSTTSTQDSNTTSWRRTKPADGASQDVVRNGKTFHWCNHCKHYSTTHGTATHTGQKPSDPQANSGIIADPSAWYVHLDPVDVDSEEIPGADLTSLLVVLAILLASVGLVYSAGISLIEFIVVLWSLPLAQIGLIGWLLLPFPIFCWYRDRFSPDPVKPAPRWQRRQEAAFYRRNRPRAPSPNGIRQHGLRRQYPHRLRKNNEFSTKAPTIHEQQVTKMLSQLLSQVNVLQHVVNRLAASGREGETTNNPAYVNPRRRQSTSRMPPTSNQTSQVHQPHLFRQTSQVRRNHQVPNWRRNERARHFHVDQLSEDRRNAFARATLHAEMAQTRSSTPSVPWNYPKHLGPWITKHLHPKSLLSKDLRRGTDGVLGRNGVPVIWDTGASMSITPDPNDLIGRTASHTSVSVQGIGNQRLRAYGIGWIRWYVPDDRGGVRCIQVKGYHVPDAPVRLLATTSLLQHYPGEHIIVTANELRLTGDAPHDPMRWPVTVPIDPQTNLPTSIVLRDNDHPALMSYTAVVNGNLSVVHPDNFNLSDPQKELLRWHTRLGHVGFKRVQYLLRSGVLGVTDAMRRLQVSAAKMKIVPKCAACLFGKQKNRSTPGRRITHVGGETGQIRSEQYAPGQKVSVDHYICSTKGRLYTSYGKTDDSSMYSGGCIFVDHASGYVHNEFQAQMNTHQTLQSKNAFEAHCRDNGIIPVEYLTDNGSAFTSSGFTENLRTFQQIINFAGTGAHHHNALAERTIGTIMSISRTMLMHASTHWPEVIDTCLWPMAVAHAIFIWNRMPDPTNGLSPIDIWRRSRYEHRRFHDLHVWGCPMYVLDKRLSDGTSIPRWKPRSQRMSYMGISPRHAMNSPLALNPDTGSIRQQWNVVFDDWFATISAATLPDFNSTEWTSLFGDSIFLSPFDEDTDEQPESPPVRLEQETVRQDTVIQAIEQQQPTQPLNMVPPATTILPGTNSTQPTTGTDSTQPTTGTDSTQILRIPPQPVQSPTSRSEREPSVQQRETSVQQRETTISSEPPALVQREITIRAEPPAAHQSPAQLPSPPIIRKSSRQRRAPTYLRDEQAMALQAFYEEDTIARRLSFSDEDDDDDMDAWACYSYIDDFLIQVHAARAVTDPDTLTYEQAMITNLEERDQWRIAAENEIKQLVENHTWVEVPLASAKTKILPVTWVFRRKRTPDGTIKKYKGRLCVRGDLGTKDHNAGETTTHAPVAALPSVRLFLVFCLSFRWSTYSIDFSNAFVQAKLMKPIWIHLPRGFTTNSSERMCLKLQRSLYGLSVAPYLWFKTLFTAFDELGFIPSNLDPCLLLKPGIIVVVYCDDCGIGCKNPNDAEKLIRALEDKGFNLTREGTFTEFLGIKFETNEKNGTITLSQKGLVDKTLAAADMTDCNPNFIPASTTALGLDPEGEPMTETWNYRSIVGMLQYLAGNTRPDISYAVSQIARFSANPKKSHATAVKTILRYLKRTSEMGIIMKPTDGFSINCYVDADFGGLFRSEPDSEPTSARSRTGYILQLNGCPLIWKSTLQTQITLSTQESEYHALTTAMRVVIPMRQQLAQILNIAVSNPQEPPALIRSTVFEDNNGALALANNQRITNRTRYYLIGWHWFWSHVGDPDVDPSKVGIVAISTDLQGADILTKGLSRETFEKIRLIIQGW